MAILVLATGGTIGSLPYDDPSKAPKVSDFSKDRDFVREALAHPPLNNSPIRYIALEPRDSKFIDRDYLGNIFNIIEAAPETEILIIHGTDAILSSAEFLFKRKSALRNKVIAFTGAMVPLSNGEDSDGIQNLAASLSWLSETGVMPNYERAERAGIHIFLCDYEGYHSDSGAWLTKHYIYAPDTYEKIYADDTRYSRIRRRTSKDAK